MKNSLKYIGFVVVLAVLVLALRPDLFFGKNNSSIKDPEEEVTQNASTKGIDDDYVDRRKPSLIAKDGEDGITMYAEGYSEDDFGDAFKEPENMFQIADNEGQNSAGGLWKIFLELRFDIALDQALDDIVMRPMFTDEIRSYDGKSIEIDGYIVPFDIVADVTGRNDGSMFMLSAFPAATCFFCKGAGPESIMEVYPKGPIPYSKNVVKIKGKLKLNELDYLKMAYILEDAELAD